MIRVVLSVAAMVPAAAAVAQDALPVFSSEDVFGLEYANDPRISPDGEQIAYERRSNDIMTDATRSNIWIVGLDSGENRPLISGPEQVTSPRWSPDGTRLAYVQATETGADIRVRWMDTGQTGQVAALQKSPTHLTWSPDGRWLAFSMAVETENEPLAKPPKKPEGAEWAEPVKLIDTVIYRRDGPGFLEPAYQHVFVVPADGGMPRRLSDGEFNHDGPYSWSPDSERIYFAANRNDDWEFEVIESDIWSVTVDDATLERVTDLPGGEQMPVVSPDGRRIAYLADDNRKIPYRNKVVSIVDIDGADPEALTAELDRSADDIHWAGNGRSIYFQYDDRAIRRVARVTLDGDVTAVADGLSGTEITRPYTSGSYSVSPGDVVALTRGTPYRPADVAVVTRRGQRILTSLNDDLLGNRALGEVHEFRYPSSFDGEEIHGWYVTPPDYVAGRRYPLILEIHGGPHASYGGNFAAEIQRYAAAGYVVFYDNHRGSTSYGERFALLLQYKYASTEDFADHMSGIDVLIEEGIADPDNLFITGGSAGGIASAYAIGLTDRFRAAAVAKPVINWISKTLTADSYVYQIQYQFPGMPWEEVEHYWQRSPLSLVGNVTTPTLLLTGEEDYRTPISETEQFYQALKLRRVESAMIRIPGSPHGIAGSKPSRLIAKVDNILAWFERYRSD